MRNTAALLCASAFALTAVLFDHDKPRAMASIRQSAPLKPAMSETEKARTSISKQCFQRHVDRGNGILDRDGGSKEGEG